jgi:hypothetical protein
VGGAGVSDRNGRERRGRRKGKKVEEGENVTQFASVPDSASSSSDSGESDHRMALALNVQ